MEQEPREPSPKEQFFQQLERPLRNINTAAEVNNRAVRLFVEEQLSANELAQASLTIAHGADKLAQKIFYTDFGHQIALGQKQLAYPTALNLAQENRRRAIELTLAQQAKQPHQTANKLS